MIRHRVRHALRGLRSTLRADRAVQFHVVIALGVVVAGLLSCLSRGEWIALVFAIGFVLASEMHNSALEVLADHLHPKYHPAIQRVKDVSAASVFVASLTAAGVGALLFLPPLFLGTAGHCLLP